MYKIDIKPLNWDVDAQLGILPFFHIYVGIHPIFPPSPLPSSFYSYSLIPQGLSVVLNVAFLSGAKCVIMTRWDLRKACQLIQQYRLTFAFVAPPIVLALGKQALVSEYDLSSIKWINSGAAPIGPELADAVWQRLKIGVKQGYGLSETSPTMMTQTPDEWSRFQGSVGRLFPNMEVKIVGPEGDELGVGEVYAHAPTITVYFLTMKRSANIGTAR